MTKHLQGVYETKKQNGQPSFRASITFQNKHISLGSFDSSQKAHDAYTQALLLTRDPSITIEQWPENGSLSFDKWVSILNFRDNRIYIATPIYILRSFFQYYFSPDIILKFDMEDLFYYSSHKIQRRGKRFFVSDYGLQTGIGTRYGIKNYAVEGRDYRFVNGDSLDYRYENIEIFNVYQGVRSITKDNHTRYQAKIHINGDYIIGYYPTEVEAAIAYNKAIDILVKAGTSKTYLPNFVDCVSPMVYADIYRKLKISKKIKKWKP